MTTEKVCGAKWLSTGYCSCELPEGHTGQHKAKFKSGKLHIANVEWWNEEKNPQQIEDHDAETR